MLCHAESRSQLQSALKWSRGQGEARSERARDNSIKVLVSERRRRRRSGLQRETDRTHSHFRKTHFSTFFSHPLDEIGFSTTWLDFKHFPTELLKPAEVAQEAGSTENRKYYEEQGLNFRSKHLLHFKCDYLKPLCDSFWLLCDRFSSLTDWADQHRVASLLISLSVAQEWMTGQDWRWNSELKLDKRTILAFISCFLF